MADSHNAGTRQRGRPRAQLAESHGAVMDAVYSFLQEHSVRDLTMEGIAERAGVGKPTLYKWWPTKAALVLTVFEERVAGTPEPVKADTMESTLRSLMHRLVRRFNGMFGKVLADLIAEGQSDPAILRELYEKHLGPRREGVVAILERGKLQGELHAKADSDLLVDALFGPIYYRLLIKSAPLTEPYVDALLAQVLQGYITGKKVGRSTGTSKD